MLFPDACLTTAVTETSLGWGFLVLGALVLFLFFFFKMQTLDTAVVKLEVKIAVHNR